MSEKQKRIPELSLTRAIILFFVSIITSVFLFPIAMIFALAGIDAEFCGFVCGLLMFLMWTIGGLAVLYSILQKLVNAF